MPNTLVVVEKIVAMFLVMLVGWAGRRRGVVDGSMTGLLSRFTTDVTLPALIFTQMLSTIDQAKLRVSWAVPLLAAGVLLLGQLAGWALWRLFATRAQAPTFIFVVAITNWIYLPLPIVEALYGTEGVGVLLLCNMGVQVVLWTVGVATLHGGRLEGADLLTLLRNPGLIATFGGIAAALLGLRQTLDMAAPPIHLGGEAIVQALAMVGSLTIPLSLLVTGAQLGAIPIGGPKPVRALAGVVVLRLIAVPILAIGVLWAIRQSPWNVPPLVLTICFLISAMPVAVSCSILADRFGQDLKLAAQSIFYTTLLSIASVPALFALFNWVMR